MWKISDRRWLNPLMITEVYDFPTREEIHITFADAHLHSKLYEGAERLAVLAHLARNSIPVVPQDADLSGWPYDEDATP